MVVASVGVASTASRSVATGSSGIAGSSGAGAGVRSGAGDHSGCASSLADAIVNDSQTSAPSSMSSNMTSNRKPSSLLWPTKLRDLCSICNSSSSSITRDASDGGGVECAFHAISLGDMPENEAFQVRANRHTQTHADTHRHRHTQTHAQIHARASGNFRCPTRQDSEHTSCRCPVQLLCCRLVVCSLPLPLSAWCHGCGHAHVQVACADLGGASFSQEV